MHIDRPHDTIFRCTVTPLWEIVSTSLIRPDIERSLEDTKVVSHRNHHYRIPTAHFPKALLLTLLRKYQESIRIWYDCFCICLICLNKDMATSVILLRILWRKCQTKDNKIQTWAFISCILAAVGKERKKIFHRYPLCVLCSDIMSERKARKLVRHSQFCEPSSPAVKAQAPTSSTTKLLSNNEKNNCSSFPTP